jgi:hypothetical protein
VLFVKKMFALVIVSSLLLIAPSFAGTLNVSGRAGIYNSPGDTSSMMYGVAAEYGFTENLSVRGMVETTTYDIGGETTTYTPVSLDLIYGQDIGGGLRPYAGAGLSYNSTTAGGSVTQTTGAQAEVGVSYNFGGFSAGVEFRYMVPDLNDTSSSASTYNAYATGAFSQSFDL